MSLAFYLQKRCTLQRKPTGPATLGPSGVPRPGGWADVPGCVDVPCQMADASSRVSLQYAREGTSATLEVLTSKDIGAAAGDRLVVGGVNHTVVGYLRGENSAPGEPPEYVTILGRLNQTQRQE